MFAALLRLRFVAPLLASALATFIATAGSAQTIDLSLNVFYTIPSDIGSGGTWELVAKSSGAGTFGISAISANIRNINSDAVVEGPRATVNGSTAAGFQLVSNTFHAANPPNPSYRELVVAQLPLIPLPSGNEENLFYGVGTLTNGAPNYPAKPAGSNSIGPAFTSLTSPQNIAWATGDAFGNAAWATAANMLSGTFAAGATPAFFNGSLGQVFTSLPLTNTQTGNEALALTLTTIVRTNFVPGSADYNHDGIVDGGDYVIWRKTNGGVAAPPGSGADGNSDGFINMLDYNLWRSHYGNPSGSGSGANLSSGSVPEPTGCILLTIGALLAVAPRRGRIMSFRDTPMSFRGTPRNPARPVEFIRTNK
jgi:hypothetical protein